MAAKETAAVPDSYGVVFASIETGEHSEVHVKRDNVYKGKEYVDVRKYVKTEKFKGYTKDGVAIPLEKFSDFVAALVKLHNELKKEGKI